GASGVLGSWTGEGRQGPWEALEGERPQRFQGQEICDGARHTLGEEDLRVARLPAEPRGEVGHGADGAVVPAPLEADGADGGVALRDPDAHAEIVALLAPGRVEVPGALRMARAMPMARSGALGTRPGALEN